MCSSEFVFDVTTVISYRFKRRSNATTARERVRTVPAPTRLHVISTFLRTLTPYPVIEEHVSNDCIKIKVSRSFNHTHSHRPHHNVHHVVSFADGEAKILRTCTNELDFHLPLVNGVCQRESDGFGFLCMCGMPLCNRAASTPTAATLTVHTFGVILSLLATVIL